jgi:hypothetical protein
VSFSLPSTILHVPQALLRRNCGGRIEKIGEDILRKHFAARAHGLAEERQHDAGAGADVGNRHARLQRQRGDDALALQAREALRVAEVLNHHRARLLVVVVAVGVRGSLCEERCEAVLRRSGKVS